MTWATPRTWVAGEIPTAAIFNAHVRDNLLALQDRVQVVVKAADETVTSSTVLQNDDHLSFAVVAGQSYKFELGLIVTGAAAAIDLKVGFTFPTGTLAMGIHGIDLAATTSTASALTDATASAASGAAASAVGAVSGIVYVILQGTFVATASGTVRFQWAQNTSSASSLTVKQGSYIEAIRAAA